MALYLTSNFVPEAISLLSIDSLLNFLLSCSLFVILKKTFGENLRIIPLIWLITLYIISQYLWTFEQVHHICMKSQPCMYLQHKHSASGNILLIQCGIKYHLYWILYTFSWTAIFFQLVYLSLTSLALQSLVKYLIPIYPAYNLLSSLLSTTEHIFLTAFF